MAQSASIFSNTQSLYITGDSDHAQHVKDANTSAQASGQMLLSNVAIFNYDDRSRLRFDLPPNYKQHFGLLRGLIEFNRTPDFTFMYHRESNSFDIDIEVSQHERLKAFLNLIDGLLTGEIQFKKQLKKAIAFETQYRLESSKLYASLL
ncbi:MAG TPA: hypothetical protein VK666_10350 [Chryseolinea sp.]|nr:hypothetical protein [Chryseolinea sp.]